MILVNNTESEKHKTQKYQCSNQEVTTKFYEQKTEWVYSVAFRDPQAKTRVPKRILQLK